MQEIRVPSNFSNPEKKDMGQKKTRLKKIGNPKTLKRNTNASKSRVAQKIKKRARSREKICFPNGGDDYTGKAARIEAEALQLIESRFEYVCTLGEAKLFRKRK
jgi:hypothetical protein